MAANDAPIGTTAWLDSTIGSLFQSDSNDSTPPPGTLVPPPVADSSADDSAFPSLFGAWGGTAEIPTLLPGSSKQDDNKANSSDSKSTGGPDFWQWATSAADGLSLEALPSIGLDSLGNSGASAPALHSDTPRSDAATLHLTADVPTLGVKYLKSLIKRAGLSDQSCVERKDLEALAIVAQKRLVEAAALKQTAAANSAAAASRGTGASALAHDIADKHGKHPVWKAKLR